MLGLNFDATQSDVFRGQRQSILTKLLELYRTTGAK